MVMHDVTQPSNYERKLLAIVRRLPPEQGQQLLAFARFLAYETFETTELDFLEEELEDAYTEDDARWDALLASEEGQLVLEKLADEALADIRAGTAQAMIFTLDT